jgi:hypothetical protein
MLSNGHRYLIYAVFSIAKASVTYFRVNLIGISSGKTSFQDFKIRSRKTKENITESTLDKSNATV